MDNKQMDNLENIISDLDAQYCLFDTLLTGLDGPQWWIETPFFGWTVFDEAVHIAFFDHEALLALENPSLFGQRSAKVMEIVQKSSHWPEHFNAMLGIQDPVELLQDWRRCRKSLLSRLLRFAPDDRLPWYGPGMSAPSFATARLMETWAHSQDVYDVLGKSRVNGPELFHIAHLGVATFAWSFKIHGLTPPKVFPRIELTAPSGKIWTWDSPDAGERLWGTAQDFCLVVTQRRNIEDTGLKWKGPNVAKWLSIAQVFAGIPQNPPAPGARMMANNDNKNKG